MTQTVELTFAHLSKQARPYPSFLLPKEGTALALFAAGFHGWNDCVHFARAGLRCDCVDVDEQKLVEMQAVYPEDWTFTASDAWRYAELSQLHHIQWDVVSVDPYMGDAAERAWRDLYLWTDLARKLVTLTVSSKEHLNVPEGWSAFYFPRSRNVAWLVLRA